MSEVRVALKVDEGNPERYFHVQVKSKRRKGLLSGVKIPSSEGRIELKIAAAGGSVAEDQNEKYGDKHNPDECAKLAVEAYRDVMRKIEHGASILSSTAG